MTMTRPHFWDDAPTRGRHVAEQEKAPVGVTTTQLGRFQELNGEPMVSLRGRMVKAADVLAVLDAVGEAALADFNGDLVNLDPLASSWQRLESQLR